MQQSNNGPFGMCRFHQNESKSEHIVLGLVSAFNQNRLWICRWIGTFYCASVFICFDGKQCRRGRDEVWNTEIQTFFSTGARNIPSMRAVFSVPVLNRFSIIEQIARESIESSESSTIQTFCAFCILFDFLFTKLQIVFCLGYLDRYLSPCDAFDSLTLSRFYRRFYLFTRSETVACVLCQ